MSSRRGGSQRLHLPEADEPRVSINPDDSQSQESGQQGQVIDEGPDLGERVTGLGQPAAFRG